MPEDINGNPPDTFHEVNDIYTDIEKQEELELGFQVPDVSEIKGVLAVSKGITFPKFEKSAYYDGAPDYFVPTPFDRARAESDERYDPISSRLGEMVKRRRDVEEERIRTAINEAFRDGSSTISGFDLNTKQCKQLIDDFLQGGTGRVVTYFADRNYIEFSIDHEVIAKQELNQLYRNSVISHFSGGGIEWVRANKNSHD